MSRIPEPPTSVRDKGLQNHVGAEMYAKLDERFKLEEPMSVISRATKLSRPTIYYYYDIWCDEQGIANKRRSWYT